jgi:aspartate/glutamate racemase
VEGTAGRIALIMKTACERQCQSAPTVCLACTELSLAFPERRPLAAFEYDGAMYIDSTAAHIDAVFEFAVAG